MLRTRIETERAVPRADIRPQSNIGASRYAGLPMAPPDNVPPTGRLPFVPVQGDFSALAGTIGRTNCLAEEPAIASQRIVLDFIDVRRFDWLIHRHTARGGNLFPSVKSGRIRPIA
jgi:hypothetical protein